MKKTYAYEWLEVLIINLNPELKQIKTNDEVEELIKKISAEKIEIFRKLRLQIILLKNDDQTRTVIGKYYTATALMIDQVYQYKNDPLSIENNTQIILEFLSVILEEIQQFIEVNYPGFLTQEERVTLPELLAIKSDIEQKIPILTPILERGRNSKKSIKVVIDALHYFISRIDRKEMITLREANYHVGFVKDLEKGDVNTILPNCPTLHEILFVWNFNSMESLTYFTSGMQANIDVHETQQERLDYMKYEFKRMLHLPVKPNTIYDKQHQSIKSYFTTWLEKEIQFLEDKMKGLPPLTAMGQDESEPPKPYKVMVNLSADQTGLILKAFYEAQLLNANSMRAVYEDTIKRVSTPRRENLSWENVRTKSYTPERKDVVRSVEALERAIGVLKTY